MSKRTDEVYLVDMLPHAREASANLAGVTYERWLDERNLQIVVAHLLMIVGEAASKLSEDLRTREDSIPWQGIIDMRHRVVHGYWSTDPRKVWEAATEGVDALIPALERLLSPR